MRFSTGNDIVFLPATRPERTCQTRFHSRIISVAEQGPCASLDLGFDAYVWLCWSVKESVFKYHRRHQPGLLFSPLKTGIVEVTYMDGFYCSTVTADVVHASCPDAALVAAPLYARTLVREGVIVTVVSEDAGFAHTHWGFRGIEHPDYQAQSTAVRQFALEQLTAVLGCSGLRLQKDSAGCPQVLAGDRSLSVPISLAHHDRYVAWSFACGPQQPEASHLQQ